MEQSVEMSLAAIDDPAVLTGIVGQVEDIAGLGDGLFSVRISLALATIGEDGSAKWAYLEASDLGDRPTEKSLLDAVKAAQWPKPDGGDAEAHYGMELPQQSTRPPSDWNSDKVAKALGKSGDAIDKCKSGASATFHAVSGTLPAIAPVWPLITTRSGGRSSR